MHVRNAESLQNGWCILNILNFEAWRAHLKKRVEWDQMRAAQCRANCAFGALKTHKRITRYCKSDAYEMEKIGHAHHDHHIMPWQGLELLVRRAVRLFGVNFIAVSGRPRCLWQCLRCLCCFCCLCCLCTEGFDQQMPGTAGTARTLGTSLRLATWPWYQDIKEYATWTSRTCLARDFNGIHLQRVLF